MMGRLGGMMALLLLLGACSEVHPTDQMGGNIETPHDQEGDVDEPTIE